MIAAHWASLAEVLGGLWPGLHPARVGRVFWMGQMGWMSIGHHEVITGWMVRSKSGESSPVDSGFFPPNHPF